MKKILLVVSLISYLLLTGCSQINNIENDNSTKNNENMQQEILEKNNPTLENNDELINTETSENEEDPTMKYKLSDDISLSYDMKGSSFYNLYYDYEQTSTNSSTITLNSNTYTISGKKGGILEIDGKEITEASGDESFSKRDINGISVIYIENKPYIVKKWYEGSVGGDILYSINDNLELTLEKRFEELYKVGDKYIAPTFFKETDFDHMREGIVIGYWYYENNEWKYINRSINGKELIDKNGNFSEDLYIEGEGFYSLGMDYSGFFTHEDESDVSLLTTSKYKVIKQHTDLYYVYDIEMLEDSTWGIATAESIYDSENFDSDGNWIGTIKEGKRVPAGTIVEKVRIHGLNQL